MKRFLIPLVNIYLYIYVGKDQWERYAKMTATGKYPANRDYPGCNCGESFGSFIWLDVLDLGLLYHEIAHSLHWLYCDLDIHNEEEFKAILSSRIHTDITKWAIGEMDK